MGFVGVNPRGATFLSTLVSRIHGRLHKPCMPQCKRGAVYHTSFKPAVTNTPVPQYQAPDSALMKSFPYSGEYLHVEEKLSLSLIWCENPVPGKGRSCSQALKTVFCTDWHATATYSPRHQHLVLLTTRKVGPSIKRVPFAVFLMRGCSRPL